MNNNMILFSYSLASDMSLASNCGVIRKNAHTLFFEVKLLLFPVGAKLTIKHVGDCCRSKVLAIRNERKANLEKTLAVGALPSVLNIHTLLH